VKRSASVSKRATAMTVASPRRASRTLVSRTLMPLSRARDGVNGAKKKTARLIARNPFRVVAGALALGFVFAKLKAIF
jgi:hypothetical protein